MSEINIFNNTFFAMGTRCDVVLPNVESEFGEQIFHLIKNEVLQLENQISRFIDDSPISELNRTPKNKWIKVSEDIWDILTIATIFIK